MRAREASGAGPDTGARSDRLAHQLPRARGGRTDRAERAMGRLRRPAREGRTASLAHISDDISRPYLGSYISQGRQHVNHLERSRQRIADGVALARALNRTVVLPTLWCEISPRYTRDTAEIYIRDTAEARARLHHHRACAQVLLRQVLAPARPVRNPECDVLAAFALRVPDGSRDRSGLVRPGLHAHSQRLLKATQTLGVTRCLTVLWIAR